MDSNYNDHIVDGFDLSLKASDINIQGDFVNGCFVLSHILQQLYLVSSANQTMGDKMLDFYFRLISTRKREQNWPQVFPLNLAFFARLFYSGYDDAIKKNLNGKELFKNDIILFPICMDGYYFMLCIFDLRKKELSIYDSMGRKSQMELNSVLEIIWSFLDETHRLKFNKQLSKSEFKFTIQDDAPVAKTPQDCGIYVCLYAECVTRDDKLKLKNTSLYYRYQIMHDVVKKTLSFQ